MTGLQALRTLRPQLLLLLTIVLLPLALMSLYQTYQVLEEVRRIRTDQLQDRVAAASAAEREFLMEAFGKAAGFGALRRASGDAACARAFEAEVDNDAELIWAGFLGTDGIVNCASSGVGTDFSDFPGFADLVANPQNTLEVNTEGTISGKPVAIATVPSVVNGALTGFTSLSVPLERLRLRDTDAGEEDPIHLFMMRTTGTVLASDDTRASPLIPDTQQRAMLAAAPGTTRLITLESGERRLFSVSEIIADSYLVVGSKPQISIFTASGNSQATLALAFPIIIFFAAMIIAVLGLRHLVLRHMEALSSALRRFALGQREPDMLRFDEPPTEFEEVERTFNRMVAIINEGERRKLEDLQEKELLLKEIHHRVKNNLQLITSIMSMQARCVSSPEAKDVILNLQRRVRGLATLHRTLQSTDQSILVNGAQITGAVVADVTAITESGHFQIETQLDGISLLPDQAVPLTMILSEALTNAVKHVPVSETDKAIIHVSLTESEGGRVSLSITNPMATPSQERENLLPSSDLGTRLMRAFVSQLDGEDAAEMSDGVYTYTLRFTLQRPGPVVGASTEQAA